MILFLRLIPIAGREEGCPNAACSASHGVVWVVSLHPLLLAIVCTYFTIAWTSPPLQVFHGRFITGASFPGLFALGFFRNMDLISLEFRSSEQKLVPLP